MMRTAAPDFPHYRTGKPSTYPSGGPSIGPAWQWIWDRLDQGPTGYSTIVCHVVSKYGIQEKTVMNLLLLGKRNGFLTITSEPSWSRRTIRKR